MQNREAQELLEQLAMRAAAEAAAEAAATRARAEAAQESQPATPPELIAAAEAVRASLQPQQHGPMKNHRRQPPRSPT